MRRSALTLILLLGLSLPAAGQWQFGAAVDVAPARAGVFHHLDAAGRQAIAVSADWLAIAWEDNRGGRPTCHVAIAPHRYAILFRDFAFGEGECYAPGVAALGQGRFALIWEDAQGLRAAIADRRGLGRPILLSAQGRQGALAHHPRLGLIAAWSQPEGRWQRLYSARLKLDKGLQLDGAPSPVDAAAPSDDQLYPALAAGPKGVSVAWEDRRLGHTVIFVSHSQDGSSWGAPKRVSQNPTGRVEGSLGRGTGAMRPALAAFGGRIAAVWLDKRDFLSGYDVYAAFSEDGADFGENRLAQDAFGANIAQWHAAVAGNGRGELVVAWDDERDGSADVWLTWLTPEGFAENLAPPPAHGPGQQADPVIALDEEGVLHLAWLERDAEGHTRLRYARGQRRQGR